MGVKKVLVVGGGIGGLAAATALGRAGVSVEVIEIRADAGVLGVGINQPGNSLRALKTLGVLEEILAAGFVWGGIDYRDARDVRVVRTDTSLGIEGVPPNCGLTRGELRDILLGAAEASGAVVHYGTEVADLVDHGDGVTVTLSSGDIRHVDLVVAFDGIHSPMRYRVLQSELRPRYTGSVVWRKQLPRPEAVTDAVLWYGAGVKGGVIPLSDAHMYLLVVTMESAFERPSEDRLATMLLERLEGFEGPLAEIREQIANDPDGIVYSPLLEMDVPLPWHRGRVIVLGDAVHASAPHLTQGAAMAIEDAVVLADEVTRDRPIEASLREVERLRHPRTQLVLNASHAILEQEQGVTAESLPLVFQGMREHMADQIRELEGILNQPFRSPPGDMTERVNEEGER